MGPITLEETLQLKNNRISIPVTVSGAYNLSKTRNCMEMYNLPSSRGTMTRTLTLQVPKNRQHDISRQSVQPNHQDYVSLWLCKSSPTPFAVAAAPLIYIDCLVSSTWRWSAKPSEVMRCDSQVASTSLQIPIHKAKEVLVQPPS